jgi:hypothetical protein
MKIKVRGLRLFDESDGRNGYTVLAHGEVDLPEMKMSLHNVTLAWSEERGFTALAPMGRDKTGVRAVIWDSQAAFACQIAEAMVVMFKRMGGQMPPSSPEKAQNNANAQRRLTEKKAKPKRRFIPYSELSIDPDSDVPLKDQVKTALDRIHEETGEQVYTSMIEWPEPSLATQILGDENERDEEARAYDESVARHAEDRAAASGEDADAGLRRTLGLDAVEETMARAGL